MISLNGLSRYFLSTYYIPGTVVGTGDIMLMTIQALIARTSEVPLEHDRAGMREE